MNAVLAHQASRQLSDVSYWKDSYFVATHLTEKETTIPSSAVHHAVFRPNTSLVTGHERHCAAAADCSNVPDDRPSG
jgi:hypothetical protein